MKSSTSLLFLFFAGLGHVDGASHFRVCAFNLHSFGESKAKTSSVMHTLTQVRGHLSLERWARRTHICRHSWIFTSPSVKKKERSAMRAVRHRGAVVLYPRSSSSAAEAAVLSHRLWPLRSFRVSVSPGTCLSLCWVQIIARCDVALLQEVRDRKQRALPQLMELLNR